MQKDILRKVKSIKNPYQLQLIEKYIDNILKGDYNSITEHKVSGKVMTRPYNQILRDIRRMRGYSQQYVAKKLGKGIRYIYKIEKGEFKPTYNTLREICDLYEVNYVEQFIPYEEEFKVFILDLEHPKYTKDGEEFKEAEISETEQA